MWHVSPNSLAINDGNIGVLRINVDRERYEKHPLKILVDYIPGADLGYCYYCGEIWNLGNNTGAEKLQNHYADGGIAI